MNHLLAAWMAIAGTGPPVVVVVSQRSGVEPGPAANLAEAIDAALSREGFPIAASPQAARTRLQLKGVADPATCEGKVDCVAALAEPFGDVLVIGLQAVRIGKKVAVNLSAVASHPARILAKQEFVVDPAAPRGEAVKAAVKELTGKLRSALAARVPPPPTPPAHVVTSPSPPVPPAPRSAAEARSLPSAPPAAVDVTPPPPKSRPSGLRYASVGLATVATVALGVGGYQGLSAQAQSNRLDERRATFSDDLANAERTALTANVAFAAAATLAVAAAVTFALSLASPSKESTPGERR